MDIPGRVTTGVPVHRTSMLVVCPLHRGVSRHTSANCPRLTCSSLAATLLNRILPGGRPSCWAAACKLGSPTAGKRSSHSTDFGTCFNICQQTQFVNISKFSFLTNKQTKALLIICNVLLSVKTILI